jgi:hypothetical protein
MGPAKTERLLRGLARQQAVDETGSETVTATCDKVRMR